MAFSISASSAPSAPPSPVVDKWRLASQLQKAIRHGRPDAADWAVEHLWATDAAYLRYRLSVIAVEDVGAARPDFVADAFSSGWGKKAVDTRGGLAFLRDFAVRCAQGEKDRLPCDWMACTRWLGDFERTHGPWQAMEEDVALAVAFDRSQPWWMRGLSAWRVAGTERFSNGFLPKIKGNWDRWKDECALLAQDPVVRLAMEAGQHQREAHPVFLGLAIAERKLATSEIVHAKLPGLPDIGPWLSATFDKHTSDGKRAYKSWLASHAEARTWLAGRGLDEEGQLDAVGRLAFWLEGGQCDRHWTHPLARAVLADTKRLYLQTRNMNPQMFAHLCVDPAGWHAARQRVVQGVSIAPRPHLSGPGK